MTARLVVSFKNDDCRVLSRTVPLGCDIAVRTRELIEYDPLVRLCQMPFYFVFPKPVAVANLNPAERKSCVSDNEL